jgi:hypothetical protein
MKTTLLLAFAAALLGLSGCDTGPKNATSPTSVSSAVVIPPTPTPYDGH